MLPGKDLYDSAPVWAQTLAVNAASAWHYRQKYGRDFHDGLIRLEQNERRSRDQLLAEQQVACRDLLRYARQHVPYYRELDCSDDDLSNWPILDKKTVAAAPGRFISDEYSPRGLLKVQTSGTTGTPLTVRYTGYCHQMEMAFRWRHKAWGGVPYLTPCVYVSGHPVVPSSQQRPPFWRVDVVEKRLLCSSYHLAPQNLSSYVEAMRRYAAGFVHGYPSSLYVLARYMNEKGLTSVRPRAVFTASETLLDFQRAAIEQAFGTKVFNWYGNSEMTCNIVECARGRLHYRTDYGVLELLDDGTMLCTGLNNRAMPLIRYRVGDRATARQGTCDCGCGFPLIERVEGRIEDYVLTPDGRMVGRLDHLLKGVEHVREAQIIQKQLDEILLRVVRADGYGAHDEQTILTEARQRLGPTMQIKFEYPEAIERTTSGKFRFIVSQLPREQLELNRS